ncbi:MAG: HDIG domain-containing protein [Chloroflexi bacterium]|nr:HDIG domain-containing protein [Chloroflexota bacterium]
MTVQLDPFGQEVYRILQQRGFTVYPVGGYVRDLVLGRTPVDVDMVVDRNGRRAARILADVLGGSYYTLDEESDTGRVIVKVNGERRIIDVARLRGRTLLEDLSQRDFTINAMGMEVRTGEVVDPFKGLRDLDKKLVRMLRPEVFLEDPVRLLRGPRLCAQLGFTLEESTEKAIRTFAGFIGRASVERVRDELVRLMRSDDAATWIAALDTLGLLEAVLPEVKSLQGVPQPRPHYLPVYEHTLETVRRTQWIVALLEGRVEPQQRSEVLVAETLLPWQEKLLSHLSQDLTKLRSHRDFLPWGALAHDWGKPKTYRVDERGRIVFFNHERVGAAITADAMRRLRFARREVEHMVTLVRHHMRPFALVRQVVKEHQEVPSRRAVYRFFRDTGDAGVDVLLINLADDWATYGPRLRMGYWEKRLSVLPHLFDAYFNRPHEVVRPRPLLKGRELMDALGLQPGPTLGRLLNALVEAQAAGDVHTRAQALQWAKEWLKEHEEAPAPAEAEAASSEEASEPPDSEEVAELLPASEGAPK